MSFVKIDLTFDDVLAMMERPVEQHLQAMAQLKE